MENYLIVLLYSYIFGSIPFGLILSKIFLNKDIRKLGSGNIGATNVLRIGGKILGITTLIMDVGKAFLAVKITSFFFKDLIILSSMICFVGHIFSVWLKFKGGKGVAVFVGILAATNLQLLIIFIILWCFILLIFKYSSIASIVSIFLILIFAVFKENSEYYLLMCFIFVMTIYTHKENIYRLKNKKEKKI